MLTTTSRVRTGEFANGRRRIRTTIQAHDYVCGGDDVLETLEQIEARGLQSERILLSNMKCNGWNEVVRTESWTLPLEKGDVVLS